jgi:hypothetical protein
VKLNHSRKAWEAFIARALQDMNARSRLGFAVNFLHAQGRGGVPQLYATAPQPWVRFCEDQLGARATVLDGYGLREWTLLVTPGPRQTLRAS